MKRAIFILLLALCVVSRHEAHAQRALPRMRSIELRGGMVDGFYTSASTDAGYYFGVAMSRYAKHADKWVFGVEYLSHYYPYKAGRIPMAQFTAEGGYYYKFFADPSHTFLFYVGGSAMTLRNRKLGRQTALRRCDDPQPRPVSLRRGRYAGSGRLPHGQNHSLVVGA